MTVCQALIRLFVLSASASTSAYRRPRARVQLRSPIARRLAGVDQITPSRHAVRRDAVRIAVVANCHSAPSLRLDVHLPERLGGAVALVGRQVRTTLFSLLLARQLPVRTQLFGAQEHVQPARECLLAEPMFAAVFASRKAALAPGLDMDRPPSPERRVPVSFRPHRTSSNMRRRTIWTARAYLRNRAETGRLRADHRRQDKSAASGRAHGVGWIGDFRCLAYQTAGAFARNTKIFNAPSAIPVIRECTLSNDHAGR